MSKNTLDNVNITMNSNVDPVAIESLTRIIESQNGMVLALLQGAAPQNSYGVFIEAPKSEDSYES